MDCRKNNKQNILDFLNGDHVAKYAENNNTIIKVVSRTFGADMFFTRKNVPVANPYGTLKHVKNKIEYWYGERVEEPTIGGKLYFPFTDKADKITEEHILKYPKRFKKSKVKEDIKKDSEITPQQLAKVLPVYRDSEIEMREGNQYFVNGEVYPTYSDALNASKKEDGLFNIDDKILEEQRKSNIKRLKEQYFPTSNTSSVSQILFKIANSKHPLKDVAKHLMKYASINDVVISLEDTEYFKDKVTNIKGIGQYRPTPNNIRIAAKSGSKKIETLLLHEILHALSYHTLRNNGEYNKDFKKLYEKSIEKLGGYDANKLEGEYANFTIDEFFVHLFTDAQFIEKLQSIESTDIKKYDNLFEEIMDYLLSILGFISTDNLYSQAMAVASNILQHEYDIQQSIMQEDAYYDSLEEPLFSIDDSQILFNLNKKDSSRSSVNTKLNNLLVKTLNKIKVEKVDKNGVITIEPVDIKSIEQYKIWHNNNYPGEVVDALGVANILDGIIAYSTEDGITLPEEAVHFIVELILDTPEIQKILTEVDENGVRLIETTKVYNDNVKQYTEKYSNKPNTAELVDKEILGKLIAQYMYDSKKVERFRNKVLRLLERILNKFFKDIKLAYELNSKEYPIEFRKALGIIDSNITNDKYITDTNNIILKKPSSLGVITANPASKLAKVKTSLQEMIKRYDQLLQESNNKGKDWNDYKALFNNLGMAQDAEDGVHMLNAQRIADFKAKILAGLQNDPNNVDLSTKFVNINKLEKMFNTFEKSKSDTSSLYSLEYRLAKIRKYYETKNYEEGLNVFLFGTGNIKDKEYTSFNYTEHGAIYDMFKMASKVRELIATPELIRTDHIAQITEILATYVPIIDIIEQTYVGSGNKLFENDNTRNVKVGEALKLIKEYVEDAKRFVNNEFTEEIINKDGKVEHLQFIYYNAQRNAYLDELSSQNVENINREIDNYVSRDSSKQYIELSYLTKQIGLYKNAPENWVRIFTKKLKTVINRVNQKTYDDSINIHNQWSNLGYYKMSASEKEKTFYQLDSKGKPTGYINTERDVAGWVKSREKYRESIPGMLRQLANDSNDSVMKALSIPTDYNELMQKFTPIYSLEKEDKKNLTPEMQAWWKLRDIYSKLWSEWEEANTEQFTEEEVEKITEQRRQELSRYHFNKWYSENIKTYTRYDGTEVTYYSGELRRPKKVNENWNKLTDNQKQLAESYRDILKKDKLSALPDNYNFEWLTRAPQITKSFFDSISGGSKYATAKERLGSIFNERVDDDFYNVDKDGQVIKIPPLRYNKKLPNPELLTNDVLRALITYKKSINHRNIFLSAIPDLQGMIDMVSTSTVKTQKRKILFGRVNIGTETTKEGRSSNLREAMDHLMDSLVFGNSQDKLGGSERATSFFRSGKQYLNNVNLAYNSAAILTSVLSSETDTFVNAAIGDLFYMQDYKKGKKEVYTNIHNITKDFENPIKNTKVGALAVVMGVGNNVIDNMSKTNVSRGSRMLVGATKPFSAWNMAEQIISLPIIATMGFSIKKIDGVWMTKEHAKKNKIDKKVWNSSVSLYDTLEVKDGVIDFKDIPQNIIDVYFLQTQNAISQMSQMMTDTDKGTMYRNALVSVVGTNMSWLMLQIDKMFGGDIYNYESGQYQSGYYNSLQFTGEIALTAIKDTIKSIIKGKLNYSEYRDLMDTAINPYSEVKVRNAKRIGLQMAIITSFALLAYLLVGLALDDEDDEQLSPVLQMAALLALKVRIEQGAKLSLTDMYQFAMRPLAQYDATFNRFQFINSALDIFMGDDEEYTKDNIYSGMDKRIVNTIRITPYLRGIMESYLGWYLNPLLGGNLSGEISEQARAMKSKREGTIQYVAQPKGSDMGIKPFFDFLAAPAIILGNTGGKGMLQILDSGYPENEGALNTKLPTKVAQKTSDEE